VPKTCQRPAQPSSKHSNRPHWCGWCGDDLDGAPELTLGPPRIAHDFCSGSCRRHYINDIRRPYDAARYQRRARKGNRLITMGTRP